MVGGGYDRMNTILGISSISTLIFLVLVASFEPVMRNGGVNESGSEK